jgi:hypothetical protein
LVVKGQGNNAALLFNHTNARIEPYTNSVTDLGRSAAKFKDLHLAGTISSGAITSSGKLYINQPSSDTNNELIIMRANDVYADQVWTDNSGSIRLRTENGRFDVFTGGAADSISASGATTRLSIAATGPFDFKTNNLTNIGTIASGAITGTTATAAGGTNTTALASTAFVQQEITTLIGGAPSTLNDLNELAAAINDDANYNTTLTTALATKLPLAGGTLTGNLTIDKEDPNINLSDTSSSRTLAMFVDNNNSVVRASGPLLLQVGSQSAITIDASRNTVLAGTLGSGAITSTGAIAGTRISLSDGVNDAGSAGSETVFNNGGTTADFRVESSGNANMLFVDGGANRVIVGAAGGLTSTFNVSGNAQFSNGTGNVGSLSIAPSNDRQLITANSPGNYGDYGVTLKSMRATGGSAYINNIDMTYQGTVLNEEGLDLDFRVESNGSANMLVVDGAENKVGINRTPNISNSKLEVGGADNVPLFNVEASGVTGGMGIGSTGLQFFHGSSSKLAIASTGAATFSSTIAATGQITSTRGSDTGTYGFRHEGAGKYLRMGVPNASFAYFETDANGGFSFEGNVTVANKITHAGDTNTYIEFQPDVLDLYSGALLGVRIQPTAVTINEAGVDADFRVESDALTHALFVEGNTSNVYMGSSANIEGGRVQVTSAKTLVANIPYGMLGVNDNTAMAQGVGGAINFTGMYHSNGSITSFGSVEGYKTLSNNGNYDGTLVLKARAHGGNQIDKLRLSSTEAVFNEDGVDTDFRVETNTSSHTLFIDGSTNNIGIQSGTEWALTGGGNASSSSGVSIDMSYDGTIWAGSAYWAGGLKTGTGFFSDANGDRYKRSARQVTQIYQSSQGGDIKFRSQTSGSAGAVISWHEMADFGRDAVVFNNAGANQDFRVASDTNTHMLFIDGGNNNLMIGNTVVNTASGFSNQAGFGYSATGQVQIAATSNLATLVLGQNQATNGSILDFRKQGGQVGSISVTGAGTTYNTTSDRRLKDNIETITDGTDKLMAMNPVTHGWKADPEADTVHGFIAQEMMNIVPEAVSGDPEGEEMMSMDYGRITPVIVAALQDALKEIKELKTRINELENK